MPSKRYYSEDDIDVGITPSQLKRLAKNKQLPYLVWWFQSMFEDPANETHYDGREGGYQYIWGGPYEASDELGNEFGHLVSDEVISKAAAEVESEGLLEWAPGRNHPDHQRAAAEYEQDAQDAEEEKVELDEILRRLDSGVAPSFGGASEKKLRSQILRDIHKLEQLLPSAQPSHGCVGHNNPPSEFQIEPVETEKIKNATLIIREELEKEKPDVGAVVKAVLVFRTFLGWAAKKADMAVDEFAKSFGKSAGTIAGPAAVGVVALAVTGATPLVGKLFSSVVEWLAHVMLPF